MIWTTYLRVALVNLGGVPILQKTVMREVHCYYRQWILHTRCILRTKFSIKKKAGGRKTRWVILTITN
ncbi:hypothetical protein NQ317_008883 [Molorchus minor]|uniref:Uncharacterized protein n=1 Tax=Molorchus minor TaxID=1323400 RepID=A0ABQ9JL22_9CUCU|nr:hypothetical protein NQ317_008883 [Molorchus minor]